MDNEWSEAERVLRQLRDKELHDLYAFFAHASDAEFTKYVRREMYARMIHQWATEDIGHEAKEIRDWFAHAQRSFSKELRNVARRSEVRATNATEEVVTE